MKYFVYLFCYLSVLFHVSAQSEQAQYLQAKQLYNQKEYVLAKASFNAIESSPVFGYYARFYGGLCLYQLGQIEQATVKWQQLLQVAGNWSGRTELYYWLAVVSFENKQLEEGVRFAQTLTDLSYNSAPEMGLYSQFLTDLPVGKIDTLQQQFPNNRFLAEYLVRRFSLLPYQERDNVKFDRLITRYQMDVSALQNAGLPDIRKPVYDLAVLLPFLFESVENTTVISQNKLVMDLYQGMLMAERDLQESGFPIRLYPFDTKRKKDVTEQVLSQPGMTKMDLIVGPLFSGPNEAVNAFSIANQINTINPISSNGAVIADNIFSFLAKPSYETMALELAKLAIQENENHHAMIFYELNERDSVFASIFRDYLLAQGYEVDAFQSMRPENAKRALDTLAAQYDVYLSQHDADSIAEIPGRFVRQRRIRRDEFDRMNRDQERLKKDSEYVPFTLPVSYDDQDKEIVYYEKKFYLEPDSIGFILGATRSNLYANNLISAVETRGDSIKLYSYSDWLDFTMLSYNQLERLGVALAHVDFIEHSRLTYRELVQRVETVYNTQASLNHIRGYELIWFMGRQLHQHGKYFQRGLLDGQFYSGKAFEGFRYDASNDNQVVPVVRFEQGKLKVVNKSNYEN